MKGPGAGLGQGQGIASGQGLGVGSGSTFPPAMPLSASLSNNFPGLERHALQLIIGKTMRAGDEGP